MEPSPLARWWLAHVRPRDLFALLALVLLSGVSALVWAGGEGAADARKDVVVYALGIVAGVGGFYTGARVADRAEERVAEASAELRETQAALAEATALVAALRQQVAALSPGGGKAE